MSLAVLIPYRPDTPHRERIYECTSRLWARLDVEVVHCDDGLTGPFSLTRAINRARAKTDADCLLTYSVDALPLPADRLEQLDKDLSAGMPWTAIFDGQQRFTPDQTQRILDGAEPSHVGPAVGQVCLGREAVVAVRADVWDDLRGMDERFVGWGPEDLAFHRVLATVYPDGCNKPAEGLFQSLWHPDAPRTSFEAGQNLWHSYLPYTDAASMRAFYLARP